MNSSKTILIKKYENRRLYDATNSRYINLDEVAEFVKLGYEVRVIDVASGEDITRVILTQIIAEGAKTPDSSFPLDVLRQMVIASGRASQESAIRYTKAMMDLYQSTYRAMMPALNPFDFMNAAGATSAPRESDSDQVGATAPEKNGTGKDEVDLLKERVAELEKQISAFSSPKKTSKKVKGRPASQKKT